MGERIMTGESRPEELAELRARVAHLEQKEEALRFLVQASTLLGSSLDYTRTLPAVAELAVPALAEWCFVDLVGEGGRVERLAVAHADPAQADLAQVLRRFP